MNITSRSRYALKIILDLYAQAQQNSQESPPVKRSEISRRQGIPMDYMSQILTKLTEKDMIVSIRGRHGGYQLHDDAHQISVWQVILAVEDRPYPVVCVDKEVAESNRCEFIADCCTFAPWQFIFDRIENVLTEIKLSELFKIAQEKNINDFFNTFKDHTVECRAPVSK